MSAFLWIGVVLTSINLLLCVGFILAFVQGGRKSAPVIVQILLTGATTLWMIGALRWQA